MATVTDSLAKLSTAFTKMASYSNLDEENISDYEADFVLLLEYDTEYEEALNQVLNELATCHLDSYFMKWSKKIYQ